MTKQTKQVATQDQVIEIYEELKLVLKRTGEKTCEYLNGNTDATVAAKLGVGVQSVTSIRTKRFGTFFERGDTPPGGTVIGALRDEVAALRRELSELRQAVVEILPRYNKLIDTLVLPPHSVSVRHLKVPTNDKPPAPRA
ncbi:hypothetical protein [Bradyrhizobium arachidis]|uniref:Uncharacterized protein n=1 Tax=Bradyrhizobium arachidis TaxID=858423 RepID=A0AAE7NMX2_9BRAD|nr:hypothetical protein [Bradyrhizobium arachidis]QOZ68863.1 hypothetical protein WN72_22950 [Bradyrhizobium arachidis]SFV19266.1 hypothetical protein SAMN05192541_14814 [Bradyrhizobium arachidis]